MKAIKNRAGGDRWKPLVFALVLGVLAGACFNLAFGSTLWSSEGILGGLISSILVYLTT